jgi:stage V sporulation protein S
MVKIVKVKSESNVNAVAGSLLNILKNQNSIDVQTVGAGSLNQAIKALIILRGYLAPLGVDVEMIPTFQEVNINGNIKTAIRMKIKKK